MRRLFWRIRRTKCSKQRLIKLILFALCIAYSLWMILSDDPWEDLPPSYYDFFYPLFALREAKEEHFNKDLCYTPESRCFPSIFLSHLTAFGLLDRHTKQIDDAHVLDTQPTFVTAFSNNHFIEFLNMFVHFRRYFPTQTIYVYDIGLKPWNYFQLRRMPFVRVREFNYSRYPTYVRRLKHYRWKPLIIADVLLEFNAVWWIDTSVLWKVNASSLAPLYENVRSGRQLATQTFLFTGHSVLAATHPGVYEYLPPLNMSLLAKTGMFGAGFALHFGTRWAKERIHRWWVLCALTQGCMNPRYAGDKCKFNGSDRSMYAGCHRFDQSVLNVLLMNAAGGDAEKYSLAERVDLADIVGIV